MDSETQFSLSPTKITTMAMHPPPQVPVDCERRDDDEPCMTLRCDTTPYVHSPSPLSSTSDTTFFGDTVYAFKFDNERNSGSSSSSRSSSPLPPSPSSVALSPTGTLTPSTPFLKSSEPTPVPWRPVLVLLMLNAVQPLAFELVFPFVSESLFYATFAGMRI